jgi:chromosome partitioning protein
VVVCNSFFTGRITSVPPIRSGGIRRMTMIITIANHKGGTGKTTIATHLATWLARNGKRTVLVDLDTQGSTAVFLGLEPKDDVAQLLRAVLFFEPHLRPAITSFLTPVPRYDDLVLIRGWRKSGQVETDLNQPDAPPASLVLQEALRPFAGIRGLNIILDTGPYAGTLQQAALSVADHVIVPGKPEAASEPGILDIARRLKEVGRAITGVVPTMIVKKANEHKRTIEDWRDALGPIIYYDPQRELYGLTRHVLWGQLVRYGLPIWDVAPWHNAAGEMQAVLRRIAYDAKVENVA